LSNWCDLAEGFRAVVILVLRRERCLGPSELMNTCVITEGLFTDGDRKSAAFSGYHFMIDSSAFSE
jgi:hypothetical protein